MKKIIYGFLDRLFMTTAILLLGMSIALFFYDKHLCCDKGSDFIYYMVGSVGSFLLSMIFSLLPNKEVGRR